MGLTIDTPTNCMFEWAANEIKEMRRQQLPPKYSANSQGFINTTDAYLYRAALCTIISATFY
jgi:CMP-N-acetylneuraminic acid synthetase